MFFFEFIHHYTQIVIINIYDSPPYQRLVWDYKKANSATIRKALDSVNWERLFHGKDINVFKNYVPSKYITVDDKDPVWMNDITKAKIKTKNLLFKQYMQNKRFESDVSFLKALITELNELIFSTKTLYYENIAKKLNNLMLQAKTYWSVLKSFYNDKKIPLIPPFLIDDKFVTDIQTKANIFNKCFAEQCTPLRNGRVLPVNQMFLTQARLKSIDFKEVETLKIIRLLNINKAHGYDDISLE